MINCVNPTWADMDQLLGAAVPQETLIRLYDTAKWSAQPVQNTDIKQQRDYIFNAISQVCPRKTDWTKVYACKQFKDENPADYLDRCLKDKQE